MLVPLYTLEGDLVYLNPRSILRAQRAEDAKTKAAYCVVDLDHGMGRMKLVGEPAEIVATIRSSQQQGARKRPARLPPTCTTCNGKTVA